MPGPYRVEAPTATDLSWCRELQARYRDLELGIVDANVVALEVRLEEPMVATLDQRHIRAVRPAHVVAFEPLPSRA